MDYTDLSTDSFFNIVKFLPHTSAIWFRGVRADIDRRIYLNHINYLKQQEDSNLTFQSYGLRGTKYNDDIISNNRSCTYMNIAYEARKEIDNNKFKDMLKNIKY